MNADQIPAAIRIGARQHPMHSSAPGPCVPTALRRCGTNKRNLTTAASIHLASDPLGMIETFQDEISGSMTKNHESMRTGIRNPIAPNLRNNVFPGSIGWPGMPGIGGGSREISP
jgi:hypothetical protein